VHRFVSDGDDPPADLSGDGGKSGAQ
jgi:hypothetical protein